LYGKNEDRRTSRQSTITSKGTQQLTLPRAGEEITMRTKRTKLAPIHPDEILLEEFMKPLELSANKLAIELRVPANRILAIIDGSRAISADTALRLARYFGTTPEFWINLQAHYDLELAKDQLAEAIDRDVHPRAA